MGIHSHLSIALIFVSLTMAAMTHHGCKTAPENLPDQTAMPATTPASMEQKTLTDLNADANLNVIIGASYVAGWEIYEIENLTFVNKGVSGETSTEMLHRFDRDVIALRPFAVIIWGCINDVFNANPDAIDSAIDKTKNNFIAMIKLAEDNGIRPILTTELTIRCQSSWTATIANRIGKILGRASYQDYINNQVRSLNRWIIEYASSQNIMLLDFHAALSDEQGLRQKEYAVADGSHISTSGYAKLSAYTARSLSRY